MPFQEQAHGHEQGQGYEPAQERVQHADPFPAVVEEQTQVAIEPRAWEGFKIRHGSRGRPRKYPLPFSSDPQASPASASPASAMQIDAAGPREDVVNLDAEANVEDSGATGAANLVSETGYIMRKRKRHRDGSQDGKRDLPAIKGVIKAKLLSEVQTPKKK